MPTMTRAGYTPPKEKKPKTPPADQTPKKKKKKKKRRMSAATKVSLAIFALAVCVGAATLYAYAATQPYQETFAPGTSVGGWPLAGLTAQEGAQLLHQQTDETVEAWSYVLTYGGTTYGLTAADVDLHVEVNETLDPLWQRGKGNLFAAWIDLMRLRAEPVSAEAVIRYDLAAARELLALIKTDVECDPVDATVSFSPGNSEPFRFTQESVGLRLDTAPLLADIEAALLSLTPGEVNMQPQVIEPGVYAEDLQEATVLRARLTVALDGDADGVANAALAAQALAGRVIAPGERLSFNEAVGARTQARGYVEAPEPAYGEGARGVGGGVCQTATALYRLALLADVTVAGRSAAARPVPYCEMGQEAAVSDQGLDLVRQNDGDTPLFLSARVYAADGGAQTLELQLIGAPMEERYRLESVFEETELIEEPIYVRDSEGLYATYADERVPVVDAQPGYAAQVYRVTAFAEGAERSRELISQDEYAAVAPAIYVGVQQREP